MELNSLVWSGKVVVKENPAKTIVIPRVTVGILKTASPEEQHQSLHTTRRKQKPRKSPSQS